MHLDNIDTAQNLLKVIEKHVGKNSETYKWAKDSLKDGYTAKEIADALKKELRKPNADAEPTS